TSRGSKMQLALEWALVAVGELDLEASVRAGLEHRALGPDLERPDLSRDWLALAWSALAREQPSFDPVKTAREVEVQRHDLAGFPRTRRGGGGLRLIPSQATSGLELEPQADRPELGAAVAQSSGQAFDLFCLGSLAPGQPRDASERTVRESLSVGTGRRDRDAADRRADERDRIERWVAPVNGVAHPLREREVERDLFATPRLASPRILYP